MTYLCFLMDLAARAAFLFLLITVVGCDHASPCFRPNLVYVRNQRLAEELADFDRPELRERIEEIGELVDLFFGTRDEPRVPTFESVGLNAQFDVARLKEAAGPVGGDTTVGTGGLYARHCARCHGTTGDGAGRLAWLQDPYPRDFRRGIYKFKSTPSTTPPTDDDLMRILKDGTPDTAMPSFVDLDSDQLVSLGDYVKYLSMRGQFERVVIMEVALEFDEDEPLLDWGQREQNPDRFEEELEPWLFLAEEIVERWADAPEAIIEVPAAPKDWQTADSIVRGRELFFSTLTNCAQCHGNTAMGDGQTDEYDEWSKELDPTSASALHDYLTLGALPPRQAIPRNLRVGVYRGGQRLEDFFRRIKNGIAGTTMPSIALELNDEDIWRLIAYVRELPNDPINRDE